MKKLIFTILTICIMGLTACQSKETKELQQVEAYLSEISDFEIKIDNSDNTNKNGMLTIDISYRNIQPRYKKISKIYDESDQQELILSTIKKYISEDWFNRYLDYINSVESLNTDDISEDILSIYQ